MDKHFHENHGTKLEKMCIYCGKGFNDPEKFYKHSIEKHDLPPPPDSEREITKPISSAFDGALKLYKIDGSGESDLMQFMTDVKPQIGQLVCENVTGFGQKLHLVLRSELSKPTKGEETELFSRSAMVPVFGNYLLQSDFLSMVDKMVNTLFTFTASGSGWILDKILVLDVNFA